MSTFGSEDRARFSPITIARRFGYIWLMVLLIIMGRHNLAQAESLTTNAATGAIQGKVIDQNGQSLTNIQVLAVQMPASTYFKYW